MTIRRPTRSCWTSWSGTLQGLERTRTWQLVTPAPDKSDDKNYGGKADKPAAPNPKTKPKVTPVLPSSYPKNHNGKDGKPRSRSSSRDKVKTFCYYHFNKGNCKHGDKCPYSHSRYHWDKEKKTGGKGKCKSRSPGRSQTPSGKKNGHCYGGLKVNAKEEINASSITTQRWIERKQHLQRQKVTMPRPLLRSSATWTMIAM